VASTDYLDFLRLRLEQSFDRDEAARTDQLATYPKRPFSDVMLEAAIRPEKHLTLTSRTYYSPYLMRATEHEHMLTLTKEKLGELRFGHDYLHPVDEYTRHRTNDVQVLTLGADYQITDKLKLVTNYRMDIAGHSDLEKSAGLSWRDQCYEIQLLYARKPGDQSVELRFNLLDFGKP
jgi:LPS-assembly protein